ncbi:MAG: hypothetical protein IKJ60_03945 [Ruminococcus sp.]|nr:hypothetical protein [Ruminococcus sp.]
MKKKAILLLLCTAVLSGCGRVDSVDVNSQIKPFEVEQTTNENGQQLGAVTNAVNEAAVTTSVADNSDPTVTTTARTGAVNLVKRTGVAKKTVTPSKNTVRVPSRPNTTARKTTVTTVSGTTNITTAVSTEASTATSTITTFDNENPTVVTRDDMICQITDSGISVFSKGEPVQNIDIDTSFMMNSYANEKTDPKYRVNINDYDFDGYFDLFIPQSDDEYNVFGKFLRFNPTTNLFEEWEALSGINTYTTSSKDDGTISAVVYKDEIEYDEKTYQWKVTNEETGEKELRLISKKKQFRFDASSDGTYNIYIDYYEYTDGVETVVKREKVTIDENGVITGAEEVPIDWLL